ncbi:hypothetical protein N0B51_00040 [Tsuneonella sp. YG55]|uniref:Uncharacterized protein n=1 Tax=Tsuneonella litorea TaxID=2976475 RepID=A0A9X2W007_9SPHN|nr:hypothetical protein [Tsuneonella litorea]MCT2557365.1 hypothetical protein [Tsuneonella litorea]
MQINLGYFVPLFVLASVTACESQTREAQTFEAEASEAETILLYCDADSDKPVTLTSDDDGAEFEATLSYRGFYRINLNDETLETRFAGNKDFSSLCTTDRPCKLISNRSEIRFENPGRRWGNKVIDETYVFERNTGYFYRISKVEGPDGEKTDFARGSCKPMKSTDQQLF